MIRLVDSFISVNVFACNLELICRLPAVNRVRECSLTGYVLCSIPLIAERRTAIDQNRKRQNMQIQNANPPIQVTGRHVSVTEAMKEYCRRRLSCLHLDYPKIIEVQMILDVQKYRHTAEMILHCNNHITLEASAESDDMYVSVDEVVDKIARQMRKYKTRLMRHHRPRKQSIRHLEEKYCAGSGLTGRRGAGNGNCRQVRPEAETNRSEPSVIHSEKYPVKPMFIDEAVLQIAMSSSNFWFSSMRKQKVNVIYRRKNGDFGLIEPTFNKAS